MWNRALENLRLQKRQPVCRAVQGSCRRVLRCPRVLSSTSPFQLFGHGLKRGSGLHAQGASTPPCS